MSEAAAAPALDYVFHPRSIAIAGVSTREAGPGMGGSAFVQSLMDVGFPGPIYLIHPTAHSIRGLRCSPNPSSSRS